MNKTDKRIHIQHVVLSLDPGGLENGLVNVVNHLDHTSFRSSVCCLKQGGKFAERISNSETIVCEMGWRGGNNPLVILKLARLFRETGTDIVHTRNEEAFFYGFVAAKLAGVKTIIHSEHGRIFPGKPYRMLLQRLFSRHTDAIIAMSEDLRQKLNRYVGIPADCIQVIYNGVDLNRFGIANKHEVRKRMRLSEDSIVIGSVGRLVPVKNYRLLLEAIREIQSQLNNRLNVVLVGDGPERLALENYAMENLRPGTAVFVGYQACAEEFVPAFDIFVLPSLSEGISNTLLEAMAMGVPVVASKVGGNPEIVNDGESGLLFFSGNLQQLKQQLMALINNPSERLRVGNNGASLAINRFGVDLMVKQYADLYKRVYHD